MAASRTVAMRNVWRTAALSAALLALMVFAAGTFAADQRLQEVRDRLKSIGAEFEYYESEAARSGQPRAALGALRDRVEPLRVELRELIAALEPRLAQTEARLKQLGPAPAAGAPPEPPAVASEREQQSTLSGELEGTLRQARLLTVQGNQIVEQIDERRRSAFAEQLLARERSVLDPTLLLRAAAALPAELQGLSHVSSAWGKHLAARLATGSGLLAVLLCLLAVIAIVALSRLARRRADGTPPGPDAPTLVRKDKTRLAVRDAILESVTVSAAALAVFQIAVAFDLLPDRIRALASGLVTAIVFVAVGSALARAVLAPGEPARRLPSLNDGAAVGLYHLVVNAVIVTAAAVFINVVHHSFKLPELTVATDAVYALIIAALIAFALLAHRESGEEADEQRIPPWIRLFGWIAVTVIGVALVAGYVRLASFTSERIVTAAVVVLGLYLLLALVDAWFGQGLSADSPRRRSLAATLGVRVRTLDLLATLFAGLLRTLLVVIAIFVVIGTLTASVISVDSALYNTALNVEIGQVDIRLADILAAVTILLVGLLLARILHRWLSRSVLPRTDLDASLQNSISTIVGYAGVIVAASLGLARLGVNLENIALVAGALSIGIGFGLQAIVSNFVSGLILLTERPIRVGDWIVVGNEQGYVRKISVRSTEIETFDRASVIVPNSDLITTTVKNWTHADYLGRLALPVGVSYDSDPEKVRDILLAAADAHPRVLKDPEPYVVFMKFGDSALEFELRGMVANVNDRLTVTSDLHFDVFKRFRAAGIEIPFPQRDIHIRTAAPAANASDGARPPGKPG